jgi:Mn2+/Fe2+ NRAMP family transporter
MAFLSTDRKKTSSVLLGAAFLMATSAIGPGFITQTTVFTQQLTTSFGFVILCSIVIDIVVQLTIWRVVSFSGLRTQDLANRFFPGTGYLLSLMVVIGGLAFNIGNLAGAGLGIEAMTGVDVRSGVILSTVISIFIFWYKDAGKAMDFFTKVLGILMIVATAYIVFRSNPPIITALHHSFIPEQLSTAAIIILVGGTVGGYISFAGAHRLIDEGICGPENTKVVSRNGIRGILLVSAMRILIFLATLGVVSTGVVLSKDNPAASVFEAIAGTAGFRIFGLVLWCAAITSVVGAAYTSISFLRTFHPLINKHTRSLVTLFILLSAVLFLWIGKPVNVLVVVGALNGFILPFSLGLILLISKKMRTTNSYHQPVWLTITSWIAIGGLVYLSVKTILFDLLGLWN